MMQTSNNRIVITGAPGSGKTSLVEKLEQQGYCCEHEIARDLIREALEKDSEALPWKNLAAFSRNVLYARVGQHVRVAEQTRCFFDRGIPDVLAYMCKDKLTIPESFYELAGEYRYHKRVFITPPWEAIYANDAERKESFEQAQSVHVFLEQTYQGLGYELVELPKVSIEERVAFLLDSI